MRPLNLELFLGAGPAESIIYGPRSQDVLDSEEVCWPTRSAYMFVYNGCPAPVTVNITVSERPPFVGLLCRRLRTKQHALTD